MTSNGVMDLFNLDGHAAVVVGGNRGLGLEMAKALAEAGAAVAIASRDPERNRNSEELIRSEYSVECFSHRCDVSDEGDVTELMQVTEERFGKIDILVNSAGINVRGAIEDLSRDDFERVMRVNVTGTWLACKHVTPVMRKNGYGRIVNVGSMLSISAIPERTPYATSKGAVLQLTRSLAIELARDKITVNALLPGPFATELNLPLTQDEKKYQEFVTQIPMGRWGELHEIGGLALYLASPASSFVTGAGFLVDGGWTLK